MASGYPGTRRPRFDPTRAPTTLREASKFGGQYGRYGDNGPPAGQWQTPGLQGRGPGVPYLSGSPFQSALDAAGKAVRNFVKRTFEVPPIPIVFDDTPMSVPGTSPAAQGDAAPNGFTTVAVGTQPVRPVRGFWYFSVDGCPPGSGGAVPFVGQAIYPTEPLPWFASCIHRIQVANNPAWSDTTHVYSRTFSFDLYHGDPYQTLQWTVPGWWFPAPIVRELPVTRPEVEPQTSPPGEAPYEWPGLQEVPTPLKEAPPGVEWYVPAEVPFLDPWYTPIERPGMFPKPVPYRLLPRRKPGDIRLPHRVVGPGGVNEQPTPLVPTPPRPFVITSPGGKTEIEFGPPGRKVPPPFKTKERKFIASLPARSVLGKIVNEVTEGIDMIECLFKALPKEIRKKAWTKEMVAKAKANPKQGMKGSTKPKPIEMFLLVYGNVAELDKLQTRTDTVLGMKITDTRSGWEWALWECLQNQAEDFAFGKAGKAQAKATQKLAQRGFQKRPVGPMSGPAM